MLVALTTTLNVQAAVLSSVALEQQVRCGLEEHIHTQECYLDELLVCTKKAHTHSENCYLLLLGENNVNALLGSIETAEDNSLDTLIADVVNDAILYEDSALSVVPAASSVAQAWSRSGASSSGGWTFFTSASSSGQAGAASSSAVYAANTDGQVLEADISLLNENIVAANIQPYMVLNTNLTTMALTPEDTEPIVTTYASTDSGVATLSLDDTLGEIEVGNSSSSRPVYLEIYILSEESSDTGQWVRVSNTLTYTNRRRNNYGSYYKTVLPSNLTSAINSAVDSDISNYSLLYESGSSWTTAGNQTISYTTYTTFGTSRNQNTTGSVTARVYESDGRNSMKFCVLTYADTGGNTTDYGIYRAGETVTVADPGDGYVWTDQNGTRYNVRDSITLTTSMTLTLTVDKVTVTYLGGTTTPDSFTLSPGDTHTIDPNHVLPEGYIWIDESGNRVTETSITVRKDTVFRAVPATYAITYLNADGTQYGDQQTVDYGQTIPLPNLPSGTSVWAGSNGKTYSAGDTVTVTQDLTFTAASKTYTVQYIVNFPTITNSTYDGEGTLVLNSYTTPTVTSSGQTGTSISHTFAGSSLTVSPVSENIVIIENLHSSVYYNGYPVQFEGWDLNGDGTVDIQPGTVLTATQIANYAADDTITFTGVWTHAHDQTVNFFLLYTSQVDEMGSSSPVDYTPSVFTTVMNGPDADTLDAMILATSDAQAYTVDQTIVRPMYGPGEGKTRWLSTFPRDEDVFQWLIDNQDTLQESIQVGGETISINDLNTGQYVIRWCKVQLYNTSGKTGWHIDGKIVKKEGQITVNKEFLGEEAAITAAEKDFYITAANAAGTKSHTLTLSNADTANTNTHSYEWVISGVELNERWTITEHTGPVTVNDTTYICYPEYSVRDSDGNSTAIAEFGTIASVIGKTYALDEDPDQGLMVDFRNYYYPEDSMLLKKEDAATGQPIGNVTFRLYQPNEYDTLIPLKFTVDPDTGQYIWDPDDGTVEVISTGETGYSSLKIAGFSFEKPVYIEEVSYPTGYLPAPRVIIGQSGENVVVQGVEGVDKAKWSDYAEFIVENGNLVAVIKNHTGVTTSLTVEKKWEPVDAAEDSVTVVLQANGSRATNLFPALSDVEVTLSDDNSWTHTWTDLPCYAGGTAVEWGVQEIKIGSASTLSDGKSFANWIASVTLLSSPDADGDGVVDAWSYLVTNTPRRTMIRITKTDQSGAVLPGATFTLMEYDVNGIPVSGAAVDTQVSDANGHLTFDNLTAGKYYLLTETDPPGGCLTLFDSMILTVDGDGLVREIKNGVETALTASPVVHTSAYNLQVYNRTTQPLPETGGAGTNLYICSGLMLMLTAAGALWYKNKRRKEGQAPP